MKHHGELLGTISLQSFGNYDVTVMLDHQWNITISCYDFSLMFWELWCPMLLYHQWNIPWISHYYFSSMLANCYVTEMLDHQWNITLNFSLLFQFNAFWTIMSQWCLNINETWPWSSCYYFISMLWELLCHNVAWPSKKHPHELLIIISA